MRQAVQASLPSFALLRLDSAHCSVLEIELHEKLKDKTVVVLKMMGIAMLTKFDSLETSTSRPRKGESFNEAKEWNLHIAIRRVEKHIGKAQKRCAARRYTDTLMLARQELQDGMQKQFPRTRRRKNRET